MKSERLFDAIGEIRSDMIQQAEQATIHKRKKSFKTFLIAAIIAALLVQTVSAEIIDGTVSNLLAPLYGMAQTELVNDIGFPVGASTSVNGYTLTAQAVIGDKYNLSTVYTLTKDDGSTLPANLHFETYSSSKDASSYSLGYETSEDGKQLNIIEQYNQTTFSLFQRHVCSTFENLVVYNPEVEKDEVIAEGVWELKFNVRYKDTTVKLPIKDLDVIGTDGNKYQIHNVMLSNLSLRIKLTAPNTVASATLNNTPLIPDFSVSLSLKDGTNIDLPFSDCFGAGSDNSSTMQVKYSSLFKEPILLEDIESITICDTTIPIDIK